MVEETKIAAESAGALGSLGLNGKLFLAQLVNFGLVLFVMWRWVYRPLLKILDERSKRLEKGLKDAEEAAAARKEAEAEGGRLVIEARQKAKAVVEEALAAGEKARQEAAAKAKEDVEKIVAAGKERLRADQEKMSAELKAELVGLVASAVERIAGEKLDARRDEMLIRRSLERPDQRL